ncbi:MAG: sodium:solute symporter family transporter [Beijerinckiaceae bacterium]
MRDPLTEDERLARAGIEGRVAFVAAALFLSGSLLVVIDRVGAPARLVATLGPAIAMGGLVALGFLVQAMRIANFYAAGRIMPAKYVGLALAGLAAALIPPMLPPGPPGGLHAAMLAGLAAGVALAGFGSGPLLRKSGAFSLPDLFGVRFESPALRSASAVVVAAACGLVALAGFDGAVRSLQEALGLERFSSAALVGFIVLAVVAPGGLAGSAWAAAVAAFVLSLALLMPIVMLLAGGSPLPAPYAGRADLWAEALSHMALWNPSPNQPPVAAVAVAVAVAIGVAALSPLLSPMIACRTARTSSRAGVVGLGWFLVLAAAMLTGMAISVLSLDALVVGKRPDALPPFIYLASDKGLLSICGQFVGAPRAAAVACSAVEGFPGQLDVENLWASGRYFLTGLPELGRFSLAMSALVSAGYLAAALALAAAGVQACATALGHDLVSAARGRPALTSRRLAASRLVMIGLCLALAYLASGSLHTPQNLLALAVLIAASALAPLLLLTAWSRATAADAALTFAAGVCAAAATAALAWRDHAFVTPVMASGALAGFAVASLAGYATSLRRKESETRPGRIFVEGLLYGDGEVMGADRI